MYYVPGVLARRFPGYYVLKDLNTLSNKKHLLKNRGTHIIFWKGLYTAAFRLQPPVTSNWTARNDQDQTWPKLARKTHEVSTLNCASRREQNTDLATSRWVREIELLLESQPLPELSNFCIVFPLHTLLQALGFLFPVSQGRVLLASPSSEASGTPRSCLSVSCVKILNLLVSTKGKKKRKNKGSFVIQTDHVPKIPHPRNKLACCPQAYLC